MIENGRLWKTVNQIAKTTTSGYQTEEEWNRDLFSVQWAVISVLCDNYENNQKVSDALVNHVVIVDELTSTNGVVGIIDAGSDGATGNYYRTLAVSYLEDSEEYPSRKVGINERAGYKRSSIRRMSLETKKTGYSFGEGCLLMLPEQEMEIRWYYCRKPEEAILVLTDVESEDSDYQEVDESETTNIEFPESLFNLFTYLMLERLGVELKDQVSQEYSKLGIATQIQTEVA